MLIWIHAPKGFRPSNWVDMLCDIDEAFDLDRHLVDPSYVTVNSQRHYVLQVMCSLLDESGEDIEERHALFRELMCRVAALGLQVTVPQEFAPTYATWWEWLEAYCADKKILLQTYHPEMIA